MLEKPTIPDFDLISALQTAYGVTAAELTFLPIGADSTASVYRVTAADGQRFFLKLKRGDLNPPSYLVPRLLRERGIDQIVAPLPTQSGALWHAEAGKPYSLILYPNIDGQTGFAAQLTLNEWHRLGQILARIHGTDLRPEQLGGIRHEDFSIHPKSLPMIEQCQSLVDQVADGRAQLADPHHQELVAFWQEKSHEIDQIVARTVALGQECQKKAQALVPCHADFHTFNVLVEESEPLRESGETERALYIVDWDETLLAPVERDLMFVIGQNAGLIKIEDKNQAAFLDGYRAQGGCPAEEIDPVTIAYYRYEWVVQEIGEYGALALFDEEYGEETRADAVREFKELFEPGNVVEGAYRSEKSID